MSEGDTARRARARLARRLAGAAVTATQAPYCRNGHRVPSEHARCLLCGERAVPGRGGAYAASWAASFVAFAVLVAVLALILVS
ncbi:MAG TPA: hypothetical protein VFO98_16430 [Marmoricola sp.]|jgi:hypothetical protein|nr:hypothetical protein [Marmoricola sp.]